VSYVDLAANGLERLTPGTVLRARSGRAITVGAPLGEGGQGVVLRARCDREEVALKIFKAAGSGTSSERLSALVDRGIPTRVDSRIAAPTDIVEYEGRLGHVSRLLSGIDVGQLGDAPTALNQRQRAIATVKLGALLLKLHAAGMAFGDLNKGAVKIRPTGDADVEVGLVDLDSAVMKGVSLPGVLGTPDTAAPELRQSIQPSTVAGWQAADWTAFGHVAVDLLLAKTASCGIDDVEQQIQAYMGVPPFLQDTHCGRAVDRAAGLPSETLSRDVRATLRRLFEPDPGRRDGPGFVRTLLNEIVHNRQIQCGQCGALYFAHDQGRTCPMCARAPAPPMKVVLTTGRQMPLSGHLDMTREMLGGHAYISRLHARLFTLGSVPYVVSLTQSASTVLVRGSSRYQIGAMVDVPVLPGDRLQFGSTCFVEVLLTSA
jgi:DNA-binding helix-hairpin-helix protein with protein kinase domain